MPDQTQTLLLTKLHRPRLPHDLVVRTRLIDLLNRDIDRRLILVCAPAGFGKTTLVSSWLDRMAAKRGDKDHSLPAAWLSLDENDSDLNLFLRYFIAALRTIFSEACDQTLALLQARQSLPQDILLATFSNDLEQLPGEVILVLDDYHTLHNIEVHQLLAELVRHWPQSLHLVLISRLSPPIPLDNMRARGMLSEIRTRELRFTHDEVATYLSKTQFALMTQRTLPLLEERFEGWPAGLHLAAISFRSADSQEPVLSELSGENVNITGYLMDEVLRHQLPVIQTFLLKTSILDHFCAPLCEAVLGEVDPAWNAGACLDWIERSELFIISLDNQREWYRYHHLFQQLLQQQLRAATTPGEIADLHRRAANWFEEHGLVDEAIHHALAAGDRDLAARQMYAGLREALNREDRPTLERWLRMMPEEMIQHHPELLIIRAWAMQFAWRLDLQAKVIQQVEDLLDSGGGAALPLDDLQILHGQILLVRAQQAYFSNQTTRAIDLCREVQALLPSSWTFVRGGAMLYLGMSMQASGQTLEAERWLLAEYESYGNQTDIYALFLLQSLGFDYLNTGQLEQTRQIAHVLIRGASRSGMALMKNWGDWFLGVVCYQRNELEAAAQHFNQIVENRYIAQISAYRDAVAGLALIHEIKGESSEAWQMVEAISQFDLERSGSEDSRTRSLHARLMLLQGNLEDARRWADTISGPPPDQPYLWLEEPQVTRVHILLASHTDADRQLALKILDALDEIVERTHNIRYKIEILALRALASEAEGHAEEAETVLKQAVDLARPGGFIRIFVDMGAPMQAMIQRLIEQGYSKETLRRILAAFPEDEKNLASLESPTIAKHAPSAGISNLVEPLTPRELEVLNVLRGPMSIKEIAQYLNISYSTAKRHTINIYAKLGVNTRWNAVATAELLNILPPK